MGRPVPTTLEFPWPPPQLMPNFKRGHHWSKYRKQANAARTLGWGMTVQALGPTAKVLYGRVEGVVLIEIEATPPLRPGGVPDEDGLRGACKHYLDGIADALGVNDSRFTFAQMVWHPKAGSGKVVIRF